MINISDLAERIRRIEPYFVSVQDYTKLDIFDDRSFLSGTFEELSGYAIHLDWAVVWIDWHVPRVEIHELETRELLEHYLTHVRCPFFEPSCGGFFVVQDDEVIACELICETTDGDLRLFEPDTDPRGIDFSRIKRLAVRWK